MGYHTHQLIGDSYKKIFGEQGGMGEGNSMELQWQRQYQ